MTARKLSDVPGLIDLLGRGVYTTMPPDVETLVSGGHAVVVADPEAGAEAALRLSACACCVTLITRSPRRGSTALRRVRGLSRVRNIAVRLGIELVWAAGIEHLEAVVLRRTGSGRIDVCNAAALFLLSRE